VIKLASNENAFGPSPRALRAIHAAAGNINRYPDAGSFYLKKAISKKFHISPDRIVLGNGSDELIVLALRACLEPGDQVVMAWPTFLIYRIATWVQGGVPREVPMKDFRYDLRSMQKHLGPKTKAVFIANPDNPVGTYVTHRELEAFVRRVPKHCLCFIDEAYYEFAKARSDFPRSLSFLKRPNVVISRSFSKAYGLSGLRIGYAFGSRPVISAMERVREPFNINALAQTAATEALKDEEYLKRVIRSTEREKQFIQRELQKLRIESLDSATNFVLIRLGSASRKIYQALLREGVIVRSLEAWGLDAYLRVTVGTRRENIIFVKSLKKVLGRMPRLS